MPTTAWSASRKSRPSPSRSPAIPQHALASMGIYVFNARFLFEQLCLDATRHDSKHDFGRDIIPAVIRTHTRVRLSVPGREPQEGRLLARRGHAGRLLRRQHGPDLRRSAVEPVRSPTGRSAPIQPNLPPPKFVFAEHGDTARRGEALDSIVCQGTIVSGGQVERSDPRARTSRINSYSHVEDSICFSTA